MKKVAIIQARMASSRLPAKVLLPLPNGMNVLQSVVERAKEIQGLDEVVVAIPDTKIDSMLIPFIRGAGVTVAMGSHRDVLQRYWRAARASQANVIMRITADCPLLNPAVCSSMLAEFVSNDKWDFLCNYLPRTFPRGWDCEVFSWELLDLTHRTAVNDYDREHVTPWMHSGWNRRSIMVGNHEGSSDRSEENFCIDTLQDYYRVSLEIINRRNRKDKIAGAAG